MKKAILAISALAVSCIILCNLPINSFADDGDDTPPIGSEYVTFGEDDVAENGEMQ